MLNTLYKPLVLLIILQFFYYIVSSKFVVGFNQELRLIYWAFAAAFSFSFL